MHNKLQELTDKLYNEGLSKGKQEAEQLLEQARKKSKEIIENANKESAEILKKANDNAEEYRKKTESELKTASLQLVTTLKNSIESKITTKITENQVKDAINDPEFIKSIMKSAVAAFSPDSNHPTALSLILPKEMKSKLDDFIKNTIIGELKAGVDVIFDPKTDKGFKIGPKEEGYHISFTEENFQALFSEYIKPKTAEFLFSE